MIYLDYSATTSPSDEVLESFVAASHKYPGNPNSLHKLGVEANDMIDKATKQVADLLGVKPSEIIYTSGASESNNLALKGITDAYKTRGKHIITSSLEHSSIYGPINYLVDNGYEVSFVELNSDGTVNLDNLKAIMRDDTVLVSISAVNSEIGIKQPIDDIASIVHEYPKCFFHVDMTQAIGKIKVSLDNVDLASFSAHKFFGIKGIGVLVKKENIRLEPLVHGGKSTTIYRSGTPALPLIVSLAKALRLALTNLDDKIKLVTKYHDEVCKFLSQYELVRINSNDKSIPQIINISVLGVKPETLLHSLEEYDIYISTQSACSSSNTESKAVYAVTRDKDRAQSSVRISLSYVTTEEEVEEFKQVFDTCYKKLTSLR